MSRRPFPARFPGTCAACLGTIAVGERIIRNVDAGGQYTHADRAECREARIARWAREYRANARVNLDTYLENSVAAGSLTPADADALRDYLMVTAGLLPPRS